MKQPALVIMAKEPAVGRTKTRLCPPLTPIEAASLYTALLRDTIALGERVENVQLAIAVTPPQASGYFRQITPMGTLILPVACADIGECLSRVQSSLLAAGHPKVIALNSDGPTLPPTYLRQAIVQLDSTDVVLGPSDDGGYYLIGLKQPHPELFDGIAWSTDQVMDQTRARARDLRLVVAELPPWYDVDTADDLARLQAELATLPGGTLPHTRRFFSDQSR
jgi:rSAM/selenodomain-associated transferase 1